MRSLKGHYKLLECLLDSLEDGGLVLGAVVAVHTQCLQLGHVGLEVVQRHLLVVVRYPHVVQQIDDIVLQRFVVLANAFVLVFET